MLSRTDRVDPARDRVALKDELLVYRACSTAFAHSLGCASPDDVIGKTDFELLPNLVAREQMALDTRAIFTAQPDIGTIPLEDGADSVGNRTMIVRTPVLDPSDSLKVRGIDIRLVGVQGRVDAAGGPVAGAAPLTHDLGAVTPAECPDRPPERDPFDAPPARAPAAPIDYRTLVDDGLQGSIIFQAGEVLFADDNAARVLGYGDAASLIGAGPVDVLFAPGEVDRIAAAAAQTRLPDAPRGAGRLTLTAHARDGQPLRLIGRVAAVEWGRSSATLLSFVDVAGAVAFAAIGNDDSPQGRAAAIASAACRVASRSDDDDTAPGAADTTAPTALTALPEDVRLLQVSERRFRHYARAGADFFWELDANLRFRAVPDGIERVLGIPPAHLVGRTHRQLGDHPANADENAHWGEHIEQIEAHRPFRDFEFRWSVAGDTRVIRYSGLPVFDRERRFLGYRGVGCDVTTSVRQAEATTYHANHDALTGLVNRRHFEDKVAVALENSRERRESHALFFMDLDNFKIVNDTCGHKAGDELLRQLARLFDSLVRKSDVLGRLGGDEFGVFLYKCDVAGALKLANQVRAEVENFEFLWEGKRFSIGVSVGLVVVDDRWDSIESLFSAVDSACYIAKNEGRNRVVVYREGEGNASNRKVATHWVEEIDTALASERLLLAAQKIVPLQGAPDGIRYEMLLRLRLPDERIATPRAFLPAAERYGLAAALDERAVEMTLAWLRNHPEIDSGIRHVSLNLGPSAFTDETFAIRLIKRIQASDIAPSKLCFELAETATIANLARASEFMNRLSAIGCRFAIDDFGSGLSSFSWLRGLPIDFLKIDGRLVKDVLDDPIDFTTVRAINEISRAMGKRTIAQFVESPRLLNAVRDIGIDFAQGYHVAEPELVGRQGPVSGDSGAVLVS